MQKKQIWSGRDVLWSQQKILIKTKEKANNSASYRYAPINYWYGKKHYSSQLPVTL